MNRFFIYWQAIKELGFQSSVLYGLYQLGLKSGYYKYRSQRKPINPPNDFAHLRFNLPDAHSLREVLGNSDRELLSEAEQISRGQFRMFGGDSCPIQLNPPLPLVHWTEISDKNSDIKLIWEPARFGWAFTLARAYQLTQDEKYALAFWQLWETFSVNNPPYYGPNWSSGQEVALRLHAITFAARVFQSSPHSNLKRLRALQENLFDHISRISLTLIYARAQNNNHLISEALGLYLAALIFPQHKDAKKWRETGWKWFNHAIQNQIQPDGTYLQQSVYYHRLMLQEALWFHHLVKTEGRTLPQLTLDRLASATQWLLAHMDFSSGLAANLGHNDGSDILPLAPGGYSDFRPVIQASARDFLGYPVLPEGPWNELCLWLRLLNTPSHPPIPVFHPTTHHRLGDQTSWATMRIANFSARPAHADQLHVEIWFQGQNVARDSGTYRYTAPAPWENALAATRVHNTVTIDGQDQMLRAGRFLWLKWAQAETIPSGPHTITAQHNGYRRLGVNHQRTLQKTNAQEWKIIDVLMPIRPTDQKYKLRLHWLLPDWPFVLKHTCLQIDAPFGMVNLEVLSETPPANLQLTRAGVLISGTSESSPVDGWYSATYNQKLPALSFSVEWETCLPFSFSSNWSFLHKASPD